MPAVAPGWLRVVDDGVIVRLKVTPKADRDAVTDVVETPSGPALGVRIRAAPESGKATAAAITCLAHWAGVAKSTIELHSGATSRLKTVLIRGDSRRLQDILEKNGSHSGQTPPVA